MWDSESICGAGPILVTGATDIIDRERWAGAVDCVGGTTLASTVFPFILRGVSLLGIDSVAVPIERHRDLWGRLAGDLRPKGLGATLDAILAGNAQGRTLVRHA